MKRTADEVHVTDKKKCSSRTCALEGGPHTTQLPTTRPRWQRRLCKLQEARVRMPACLPACAAAARGVHRVVQGKWDVLTRTAVVRHESGQQPPGPVAAVQAGALQDPPSAPGKPPKAERAAKGAPTQERAVRGTTPQFKASSTTSVCEQYEYFLGAQP